MFGRPLLKGAGKSAGGEVIKGPKNTSCKASSSRPMTLVKQGALFGAALASITPASPFSAPPSGAA